MSTPVPSLFDKTEKIFRAAESKLRSDASAQAESLFRWTLGHIVLGRRPEGAEDWLASQLAAFTFSQNRKADARRWSHLLATAAALGHPVAEQAQAGCRWLGTTGDATEYALAQYGLALCSAGDCRDRSDQWFAKLLPAAHDAEVAHFAFELLFVFRALDEKQAVRDAVLTDVVARIFADSLWFTQPYSAAAHVCAFTRAGSNGQNRLGSLFDRLSSIDARNLDASGRPKITFSPVQIAVQAETIVAMVTAQGEGAIDPGIHDLGAFASALPQWLATTVQSKEFKRHTVSKGGQRIVVKCVLERKGGIELSEQASAEIAFRLQLAVAIANRSLSPLEFEARLAVETHG
jgi:hypothetical protein